MNLSGLDESLMSGDFSKLATLKNAISTAEAVIDASITGNESNGRLITSTKLFIDECNNENVVVAFNDGSLCRLQNDKIVDFVELSDFGDDVTPEVTILRVPKVTTRRNVVFCVDKGGKLIVVCLVTMMKVFEWKKVRMMFGFCLRRLAVQP